jgi:hypothetical protein
MIGRLLRYLTRELRAEAPELFDGKLAAHSVAIALEQDSPFAP